MPLCLSRSWAQAKRPSWIEACERAHAFAGALPRCRFSLELSQWQAAVPKPKEVARPLPETRPEPRPEPGVAAEPDTAELAAPPGLAPPGIALSIDGTIARAYLKGSRLRNDLRSTPWLIQGDGCGGQRNPNKGNLICFVWGTPPQLVDPETSDVADLAFDSRCHTSESRPGYSPSAVAAGRPYQRVEANYQLENGLDALLWISPVLPPVVSFFCTLLVLVLIPSSGSTDSPHPNRFLESMLPPCRNPRVVV